MREASVVLSVWYLGEVGGEAFFWQLAQQADHLAARKWLALADVEARVAARLAAVLAARQIPIPDATVSRGDDRAEAAAASGRSWIELMRWLERFAGEALTEMQAEAASLPAELAAIGALVVRHEAALLAFARLELPGHGEGSLAPIREFLAAEPAA
jgi:hypothetical protein